MKTVYVEARKKFNDSEINYSVLNTVEGKTVSVAATIQYIEVLPKVKKYLEGIGKEVLTSEGVKYPGHVLGCNAAGFNSSADALVLITDGKFHGINNAIQLDKEIYVFDTRSLDKISWAEIDSYKLKNQAKKKIFLSEKDIGLLLSSKPGQRNKAVSQIKKKIEKLGKKVYVFEADNINVNEFENFPQIKIWVNTACYGMARDDKRIINLADILEFLK